MSYIVQAYKSRTIGKRTDQGPASKGESFSEIVPDRDSAERRCLELVETDRATSASFEEVTETSLIRGGLLALWELQHRGEA